MSFQITLRSDSPDWWRYNVYLTLVGYDAAGTQVDFASRIERPFDGSVFERHDTPPAAWLPGSEATLTCEGESAAAWVYAIPGALPPAGKVVDSPDFEATLIACKDGREILRQRHPVNPWGGLSIVKLIL